jgi:hypothetical protein
MSDEERERRRAYIEDTREMLRDMDAADAIQAARTAVPQTWGTPEPSSMQSFGLLPLLSSAPMERWRREHKEIERKQKQGRAAMKAEEARIMREREQAAERAAQERQRMRDYVAEQLGLLRAELTLKAAAERTHERGQIIDLPALPLRRRSNAA